MEGGTKMHKLSILLGLSGSEQSKYATEVAWALARKCGGKVCAQHVVDTRTAWDMLRNDRPGFVGSGVYIAAYEALTNALKDIGTKLAEKFQAVVEGQDVPTELVIEEGSPVKRICARALHHNLVIVGHQPRNSSTKELEHCQFVRYAVAEGLAHDCPRPLIVVQDQLPGWSTMSILVSADHLNFSFIGACVKLASILGLTPKLVIITSGTREEPQEAILKDVRAAHPELKDILIELKELRGIAVDKKATVVQPEDIDLDWQPEPDTLMVIPTRATGGHRITIFDTSPDLFVRYLPLPSIMLWPEEHIELDFYTISKEAASVR